MARKSLRPSLGQIRDWVRQGRTDAWIAHQLEATVQQIDAFKRENDLAPEGADPEAGASSSPADFDDEIDLRAEDDALIAAELEAAEAERATRAAAEPPEETEDDDEPAEGPEGAATDGEPAARRRGRRGGRSRRGRAGGSGGALEGTFDHGEEGYGLWLDPSVADNAVYAEHWAGHRTVEVTVSEDQIVIRRTGKDAGDSE